MLSQPTIVFDLGCQEVQGVLKIVPEVSFAAHQRHVLAARAAREQVPATMRIWSTSTGQVLQSFQVFLQRCCT